MFYVSVTVYTQHHSAVWTVWNLKFHMYSKVARKPSTLQSGPPGTPSSHLAPCPMLSTLLIIFPMLQSASLWLFWNYQFVLLNFFTLFTYSPNSFPLFHLSVCISESIRHSSQVIYSSLLSSMSLSTSFPSNVKILNIKMLNAPQISPWFLYLLIVDPSAVFFLNVFPSPQLFKLLIFPHWVQISPPLWKLPGSAIPQTALHFLHCTPRHIVHT